jgi:TrmH family RNA methyltransferase
LNSFKPVTPITSKANPFVKKLRLVTLQSRRAPADLVLAEGIRVLEEAIAAGHEIEGVIISGGFGSNRRDKALLARLRAENIQVYRAGDGLMKSLSDVVSPQGVLGLVRVPVLGLDAVSPGANPLILCACGIQDPGNLGSLIRCAAAADARLVCTISGTVSACNSKCVRSSAGMFFRIPVIENLHPEDFLEFCKSRSVRAFRTDARDGETYHSLDLTQATAILLGGESRGLGGPEWMALPAIRIPMSPGVESINVAAAGAIVLFEAFRQRSAPR